MNTVIATSIQCLLVRRENIGIVVWPVAFSPLLIKLVPFKDTQKCKSRRDAYPAQPK